MVYKWYQTIRKEITEELYEQVLDRLGGKKESAPQSRQNLCALPGMQANVYVFEQSMIEKSNGLLKGQFSISVADENDMAKAREKLEEMLKPLGICLEEVE